MEPPLRGVAAPRHPAKSTPPDRYLSFSISPSSSVGDELTEDEIFNSSAEPSPRSPNHHHHYHHHEPRYHLSNFGILAALPASETRSVFNHKASASSSSSSPSSSRMIPTAHHHARRPPLIENKGKVLHQSAPVNVPVLSAAVEEERRRLRGMNYNGNVDDEDEDDEGHVRMLPPHEVVDARETPVVACSVLEGIGRTLKGRDLRRVRNAVWRKTGFID